MPVRNSKSGDQRTTLPRRSPRLFRKNNQIQTEPTSILRRSPRFLRRNEPDDQKTPSQENRVARVPFSEATLISTPILSQKTSKSRNLQARNVLKESNFDLEASGKQNKGSTRSERVKAGDESNSCRRRSSSLSGKENVNTCIESSNFDELKKNDSSVAGEDFSGNKVIRVTRSSTRKTRNTWALSATPIRSIDCKSAQYLDNGGLSDKRIAQVVTGSPIHSALMTKMTGNSNKENADKGFEGNSILGLDSFDQVTMVTTSFRVPLEVKRIGREQKRGVKRKRNQVDENCGNHGVVNGWTTDQESALQRAYFTAKPTPHFWKKVARMVPGKSVQDCFNRIHADYLTPPQPKPRSRAKEVNLSPLLLSASKLLNSTRPKTKRPRCTKQKSHIVQKTMRQLLQKQYQVDRDQNADLYSVLEPKSSTSTNILQQGMKYSTPKQEKFKLLETFQEIPSLACRKQCSRLNRLDEGTLASPPVLKPVKNKALHEKYIDQLHVREAKRNAAFAKAASSSLKILNGNNECCAKKINATKSAKDALLLDARDAIDHFQHVQANTLSNLSDADDDVIYSDEDINEGR